MSPRFLAVAALLLSAAAAQAAAPEMRARAIVDGANVTLGDVLDNAGAAAGVVIARAPAPGKRMVIGTSRIYAAARANGLEWRPLQGLDRVIVQRASVRISQIDLEHRLSDALRELAPDENLRVELPKRMAEIHLPTGGAATLDIENLAYDRHTGRFSATLVAAAGTASATRTDIAGRALAMVEIPVLRRAVRRGEVITEDDVAWVEMRADRVSPTTVTDGADLIGYTPRRTLRAGRPIRSTEVHVPLAVHKGANVVMTYRTPYMTLTAAGRALADGAVGETVRVLNTQSNTVIEARVTSSNVVTVTSRQRLALN